jgi:Fic-DOC domain mobile mystery protein B
MTSGPFSPQTDGNTPISADEAEALIPNLSTRQELNEWERENILRAHRWCFSPRNLNINNPLTETYVRELHRRMFDKTWRWAGNYRNSQKNIGVEFWQIVERLVVLLGDAHFWLENQTYEVDEIATRFHHRLVLIHPFPNGNGRHARLMADVLLERSGREPFSWGFARLMETAQIRGNYISALRAADAGNITPLLKFVRS